MSDTPTPGSQADPNSDFVAGTERQGKYIMVLAKKTGYASAFEATAAALGRSQEDIRANPPSTQDARKAIEYLERKDAAGSITQSPCDTDHRPHVTAKQLRQFATSGDVPADLDEDSIWIVERLLQHERARLVLVGEDPATGHARYRRGVNRNNRIELEHLLAYFKSWDNLADAFGVTVPTAKAWGQFLPENRIFEAEVRTNGYVNVPRDRKGNVQ